MRPFSPALFKRGQVTFATATYSKGQHGNLVATGYVPGSPIPAYIETMIGGKDPAEADQDRPTNTVRWRIFSQADPNAGLNRPLRINDRATCQLRQHDGTLLAPFVVVIDGPNPAQPPLWDVEGEQFS